MSVIKGVAAGPRASRRPLPLATTGTAAAAAAALVVTAAVVGGVTLGPDAVGSRWVSGFDRIPAVHAVARCVLVAGAFWLQALAVTLTAAIAAWRRGRLGILLVSCGSLAGMDAVVWVLKAFTGRTAPGTGLNTVVTSGNSYPSGHTAHATLGLGLLVLLVAVARRRSRQTHPSPITKRPLVLAGVGAAAVGIATIVLGYHWPSDVVAGWLLGLAVLIPTAHVLHAPTRRSLAASLFRRSSSPLRGCPGSALPTPSTAQHETSA